jgi:hypothetical protein
MIQCQSKLKSFLLRFCFASDTAFAIRHGNKKRNKSLNVSRQTGASKMIFLHLQNINKLRIVVKTKH